MWEQRATSRRADVACFSLGSLGEIQRKEPRYLRGATKGISGFFSSLKKKERKANNPNSEIDQDVKNRQFFLHCSTKPPLTPPHKKTPSENRQSGFQEGDGHEMSFWTMCALKVAPLC
uniref:Uncharacterized protein n=1 Tax=Sphaerodactylus townsendi TaxID=933632 RepID=A0ACB8FL42_9SAUR